MKTVLVTAFMPFGGEQINPAAEAVSLLPRTFSDCRTETLLLPVTYRGCFAPVLRAMETLSPAAAVLIGQAGGRDAITPERVAVNLDDAGAPDNAGLILTDTPVVPGAPAAYFSTLPVKAMCAAITDAGVPARLSLSAGAYVCNHLFYSLMHYLDTTKSACRGGFIHVPYLPIQTVDKPSVPSLPLDAVVTGLTAALTALCQTL